MAALTHQTASASTYPLIVFQYVLEGHPTRTEHWNLVVLRSREEATVHELRGNYDTFTYACSELDNFTAYTLSAGCRGGCLIGQVPAKAGDDGWLKEALNKVPVIRSDRRFDWQTWVIAVIRALRDMRPGVIDQDVTERYIRDELIKEMERWNVADDTVEERLYPQ